MADTNATTRSSLTPWPRYKRRAREDDQAGLKNKLKFEHKHRITSLTHISPLILEFVC
jgi:hypothetical protein